MGCRMLYKSVATGMLLFALAAPVLADAPDVPIADFNGPTYGDWKATGTCFGAGPARGTLSGQMAVSGFQGPGLVNTYLGGDAATGTLTSPEFKIERKYIRFLIGGGRDADRLCLNLRFAGRVVRSSTGPNDKPGGSEELGPDYWDVSELEGQTVTLEIIDQAIGGWGHINVDDIVQSNQKPPGIVIDAGRELTLGQHYLNVPIRNGAAKRRLRLLADGQTLRSFELELADAQPDWWAALDISLFRGRPARIVIDKLREDSAGLRNIEQSDSIRDAAGLYHEASRPQFHFTPRRGWTNDANGLVFYQGEYHLFFQHNPVGTQWGNMTWGHAVSPDLVHWRELDPAIYPDALGTVYSGSAVVDWENTANFQTGSEKTLVCIYTSAGGTSPESRGQQFTQSLAYSNDRGRTWTQYARNPVLAHVAGENRDPKVIWHALSRKWIMALYLDGNQYALFGSPNLKEWSKLSDVPAFDSAECPDIFELPVDGNTRDTRWVFWGANGNYLIGRFDGVAFTREAGPLRFEFGANSYAAQTYSDIPAAGGRRIQIAWMNGGQYPGMPFNQQMSFPSVLTLRNGADGLRLCREPVAEIEKLRGPLHAFEKLTLQPGTNPVEKLSGDLFDIELDFSPGAADDVTLGIRGTPLHYDVARQELACLGKSAKLPLRNGHVALRVLVDRTSIEVFSDEGRLSLSSCFVPRAADRGLSLTAQGGAAQVHAARVWELRSTWP